MSVFRKTDKKRAWLSGLMMDPFSASSLDEVTGEDFPDPLGPATTSRTGSLMRSLLAFRRDRHRLGS